MATQAYPLQWPHWRQRTPEAKRRAAPFSKGERIYRDGKYVYTRQRDLTISDAITRLFQEAERLGARGVVISSNVPLRNDGLPRSGQRAPDDPGVCVYFDLAGKPRAMACDTFTTIADNIAAVAAHIDATRAIERYGVASAAEMFEGFVALPAPGAAKHWTAVFDLKPSATVTEIEARYRELAKRRHPDAGGSTEAMAELNAAKADALRAVR